MKALTVKLKISILWISFAVSASAAMIIWFIEPGILEQIMTTGEMVTEVLNKATMVLFAFYWIIPLSMAFLTQVMKYNPNRWLNLSLSICFAFGNLFYFIYHLVKGWFAIANCLILLFSVVLAALITWHAWKLPKKID